MTTSAIRIDPRALHVAFDKNSLIVTLADARVISVPLAWFPKLLHARPSQRNKWRLIGGGEGVHWIELDEDLSVAGLLAGTPSPKKS